MEAFVPVPIPTDVGISCNLCDRDIPDVDEFYFVRVRDAAFVCKTCRADNPEKEAL